MIIVITKPNECLPPRGGGLILSNLGMGHLPKDKAKAIITACDEIIEGKFHEN